MNGLSVFSNPTFGKIRVTQDAMFVASDICAALEIQNTSDALRRLDEDEKGIGLIDTLGGQQNVWVVSEYGLYALVLGSRKPEAKEFKRWITHEVIPSIREHGAYMTPQKIEEVLADPDTIIRLATRLKESQKEIAAQESYIKALEPKAEFFDAVAGSKDAISIADTAKVLNMGVGQNKLFEILRREKIIQDDNMPYQTYIDRGYFRTIEQKYVVRGETRISIKTLVMQKGVDYIRRLLQKRAVRT